MRRGHASGISSLIRLRIYYSGSWPSPANANDAVVIIAAEMLIFAIWRLAMLRREEIIGGRPILSATRRSSHISAWRRAGDGGMKYSHSIHRFFISGAAATEKLGRARAFNYVRAS